VQPALGRWFDEAEHGPAAEGPAPIILSHAFAESRFGGEAEALGRDVVVNGRPAQVVGIMPRDFRFLDMSPPFEIIVALRFDPARESIGPYNFEALARLRPGVTPEDAGADIQRMLPIWLEAWPIMQGSPATREAIENWRITPIVRPLKDDMVGGVASALWVIMGAIGAVLLVACANIANLMLVRADARRQELAIRAALGAVPARIARELLVESLVIGALGGALGLALAYGGLELLLRIGPSTLPRLNEIGVHLPVLAFTVAVSLASTLAFGSITALKHAFALDMSAFGGVRGGSASRERSATRNALVVVQVALALVLVVGATLMTRTFQALRDVHPGFVEAATIQTVRTWAPNQMRAAQYFGVQREILDAIAAIPGVTAAGFTSVLPMEGPPFAGGSPVFIEGRPEVAGETPPNRRTKFVSPGYLKTMGTRIIAGRDITWADLEAGGRVALISEDFARELGAAPGDALGKRIRTVISTDDWREVIGVVESVKEDALYSPAPSIVYWPALMANAFGNETVVNPAMAYVVRSERTGTVGFNDEIRETIWSVNRDVPIALERTMQVLYGESLARTSFALVMLAIASAMALVLGLVGIYGVIAYVAAQRSREIGIRMALGAESGSIFNLVLKEGGLIVGLGAAFGLIGAFFLRRTLQAQLYETGAMDPRVVAAVAGMLIAVALVACVLPARRAAKTDPLIALSD
jgi:predicted permease